MNTRSWIILIGGLLVLGSAAASAQHDAPPATPPAADSHPTDVQHSTATKHGETDAHGAAEKPALLTFDPGAAIWSIVVFLLLLGALRVLAWKPILTALQQREKFIQGTLDDAKRERSEAERLLAEHRAQMEQAREQATGIVDEGRRRAEEAGRQIQEQARAETEQMVARAKRELELATASAVKELYDQTASLAVTVAGSIIRKELSVEDHRQLVDESLARMKATDETKLN
ncbi:MAG: F0F1 ATP synthase subunit B [Planctomycetes bacterium]|nr:F0F1 ATP synthase subunit B [Planctomycetota bacterium]